MKISARLIGENRLLRSRGAIHKTLAERLSTRTVQRLFYRVLRIETSKTILKTGTEDLSVSRHHKRTPLCSYCLHTIASFEILLHSPVLKAEYRDRATQEEKKQGQD